MIFVFSSVSREKISGPREQLCHNQAKLRFELGGGWFSLLVPYLYLGEGVMNQKDNYGKIKHD